jgi:D-lactate dehydrogenase
MKMVFYETMAGEEEFFRNASVLPRDAELVFHEEALCAENAATAQGAAIISVFVKSDVSPEVIDALPDLKLITTRSTGYDHLDWKYAKSKGIACTNVPSYGSHTVAEFAFALLLTLSRKIHLAYDRLRDDGVYSTEGLEGFDLHGKTLGIVGTGRIGRNMIAIARGFGMEVLCTDAYPDESFARANKTKYVPLNTLLSQSDAISLHVPYLPETHHLLNVEAFSHCKKGTYLINTSRGEVVDTTALKRALDSGIVAGAALDVLEGERDLKDEYELRGTPWRASDIKMLAVNHDFIACDNVIITPHIAFETKEAMHEIMRTTAQSIANFLSGAADQKYLG